MSGAKKQKSVTEDIRWRDLVIKYRYNWGEAITCLFGMMPSHQQDEIIDSVQEIGSRTTVTSGHGTGKSSLTAMMLLIYMIMFPDARVVLVANKIAQVRTGVFKYVKMYWANAVRRHPWLQNYFVLTDTMFYEKSRKGIWEVLCKGYRQGNEESLAGEHQAHILLILDEASGISDKAIGIMRGALTEEDNRMLMLSQPTRPTGFFYESHHHLAKSPDNPHGVWVSIRLNSEESPFVTTKFIKEKLMEYGGRDSLEYKVKVLGEFPDVINGFLLGRDEIDRAARRLVMLEKDWGWIATADVGAGRDKSVLNISRVSGRRNKRRVVNHKLIEMPNSVTPREFAHIIALECTQERYPNIRIAVDSDGIGTTTADELQAQGVTATRIRWGKPMFSKSDKDRYVSQKAYANFAVRDAIQTGRLKPDNSPITAEQGSKIPYAMNELGQLCMVKKDIMRQKMNIKSPDRWDTYAFMWLVDYVPASEAASVEHEDVRSRAAELLEVEGLEI